MSDESRDRRRGIGLAAVTAVVSGLAIFFNGYGVRAWAEVADATSYTTVKNLVAALVIGGFGLMMTRRYSTARPSLPRRSRDRVLLLLIAVVGGSVPFVLFFEGLARADSAQAAYLHKTLVIWVAVLATLFLRERVGVPHVAAIGLLVWGQIALAGGVGDGGFGVGERMILAATLLWSVEVILAKKLLSEVPYTAVAEARMIGGSVVLVGWAGVRGFGVVDWSSLTGSHVVWVVVAGVLLSAYVVTWLAALSLAPAVDVTSVLVGGAVITAILQTAVRGIPLPGTSGLVLIASGVVLAAFASWRRPVTGQS